MRICRCEGVFSNKERRGASPTESAALIDGEALARLTELTGGDLEALRMLLEGQLEQSTQLVAELRRARTGGDAKALERAAHSLKGSSGIFGALEMSRQCGRLEMLARQQQLKEAAHVLAAIEQNHAALCAALRGKLAALGAAPAEK